MDDAQMTNLRNLKEMLDEGILTQKEFDDKKKAVLAGSAALVPATKKGGAPPADAPCVDEDGRLKLLIPIPQSGNFHVNVKPTSTMYKITFELAKRLNMNTDEVKSTYRVLLDGRRVCPSALVSEETITDLLARYEYEYDDDHIELELRMAQEGGRR